MKNININIKMIAFTVLTGLFLNACNSKSDSTLIATLPLCGTATDNGRSNAIDVTGKTISKVDTATQVRIWHLPDATKLACVSSGEATILN